MEKWGGRDDDDGKDEDEDRGGEEKEEEALGVTKGDPRPEGRGAPLGLRSTSMCCCDDDEEKSPSKCAGRCCACDCDWKCSC